jgi:hypothetical protein
MGADVLVADALRIDHAADDETHAAECVAADSRIAHQVRQGAMRDPLHHVHEPAHDGGVCLQRPESRVVRLARAWDLGIRQFDDIAKEEPGGTGRATQHDGACPAGLDSKPDRGGGRVS